MKSAHAPLIAFALLCSCDSADAPPPQDGAADAPEAAAPDGPAPDIAPPPDVAPLDVPVDAPPPLDATVDLPASEVAPGDGAPDVDPRCRADTDCAVGRYCHTDGSCQRQVCTPGTSSCADGGVARICDMRGAGFAELRCASGEVCAEGRCQPRVCAPGEATCTAAGERRACNADGTGFIMAACASGQVCAMGACVACTDADGDGLSDEVEGAPATDTDRDGTPDFRDTDSDGDGFSDAVEGARRYPGFDAMARTLTCGAPADHCDAPSDGVANFRDLDSDNDGLADADERAARTDPCAEDTDGDGASDLLETVAATDPTSASARLPASALVVTLPYQAPGTTGAHVLREFATPTRIRAADVLLLVDNSAGQSGVIASLRTGLSTTLVPGLRAQVADLRVGVASFDSMPTPPQGCPGRAGPPVTHPRCVPAPTTAGDYTLWMRQALTADLAAAQRALDAMHGIDEDTMSMFVGADAPECQTEAAFQALEGTGTRGHEADPLALRSVRSAVDPEGNGWVPAVDSMRDCGAAGHFGWGCFSVGRVPVILLVSDAAWYDGCAAGSPSSGGVGRTCADLTAALTRRGALFAGVDSRSASGPNYENAVAVARMAGSLNALGEPVVGAVSDPAMLPAALVSAFATLAGQTRHDVSSRVAPDPMERRLPAGRTTAEFVQAATPVRAAPDAPVGFTRRDATTFYGATPSAMATFELDLYNNFAPATASAQVFVATVQAVGRASSVLDTRTLYVIVPAAR